MKSVTLKMTRATAACVLGTSMALLFLSLPLFAQGNFGRILGTVTDQTGAVLPGATVTVTDTERGVARTLTTDGAGEYNAPTLIPGTYNVRVEAKGFKALQRSNVGLAVGQEVRVDLTPQPGDQSQTVTVSEQIALIDTASATLGGALSNAEVNDLPLNGRNYQSLLALRPGIVIQPGGSPWTQSTNNIRPDETVWMIDGVINVNFYDARPIGNTPSPFTDAATIIPIDAIQEFNTQENPKAEYGWKPGAVVNVGIRSGTNTLHGSAYAFGRDVNWAARNVFNPMPSPDGTCELNSAVPAVCDKLPAELEQFGAVVGGRIKKDKLFYFAGYEGLRSTIGNIFVVQIPATGGLPSGVDPQHSMVDAIKALQAAGVTPSPVSLKLLGCTAPAGAAPSCTGGLFAGAISNSINYTSTFPNTNVSDNGIGKIDYILNTRHRFSGMLWTGDYSATGQDHPIVNALYETGISVRSWSNVENWIWTPSSTVVNEARFAYNRGGQSFTVADQGFIPDGSGGLCTATGCGGKGYPLNTGVTRTGGLPFIQISGFAGGGGLGNPNGFRPGSTGNNPYYDYQDSVSYLRGKHALKIGAEFAHIEADQFTQDFRGTLVQFHGAQTPQVTCPNDPTTSCSTALEDFFAGNPLKGLINIGDGNRKMKWNKYAGFVEDDWRIKPRWMLNVGLRYEYSSPIREVNNLYGNFDPNSQYGLVQQGQPGVGDSLWKPDHKNFSPRVGFAWDTTGKGTTVVRAAASVMYSTFFARPFMDNGPQNGGQGNVAQNPTGACRTTVPIGGSCPAGGTFGGTINLGQPQFGPSSLNWNGVLFPQGALSCTVNSQCNLFAVVPNLKTPFVVNYNLNVQHAITNNLSLEVGYVGNHGDNLTGVHDINQCVPDPNPNACASGAARPFNSKFPYLKYINLTENYARSNYNSLQATLTKRLSYGLNFTAGYTYGHGLDNGSLTFLGNTPQDSRNPNAEYASSDFDIRHRLTVTASYAIPGKKGLGQLLEGWKLNTIVTLQSPQPWAVLDTTNDFPTGGSGSGEFADRWDFFGNPADFRSSSSSLPYCTGPGAGGCSVTSGISGIQTFFSPSESTAMWTKCTAVAPDPTTLNSSTGGCYVKGNSVMTPPVNGTYGTAGRNIFRDSGFKNVDFSVFKDFKFKERVNAQFRVELFNVFNHPLIANPYGSSNTSLLGSDPSSSGKFGCGCSTPDVAAGNPLVGSGSSRVMQVGMKFTF